MPTKSKDTAPSVDSVLAGLRKSSVRVGAFSDFDLGNEALSTGNLAIDSIIGIGGLPRGRVCELYGPQASGKTTTALSAAVTAQRNGEYVLFEDFEHSFDEPYARSLGLDPDDPSFIYLDPNSFEEGANAARKLLATGKLGIMIFDSVAAMVTEKELEAETGKANVADRAKMMYQFMRQLVGPLRRSQTVACFLNHQLELVDPTPMGAKLAASGIKRKTTPGGAAMKYNASLRLEYAQIKALRTRVFDTLVNDFVDDNNQSVIKVTVTKNKVGKPFRTAEVRNRFGKGFSQAATVLKVLIDHKAVTKSGAWYTFPDDLAPFDAAGQPKVQWQGEEAILSRMETDDAWLGKCLIRAQDLINEFGTDEVDGSAYTPDGDHVEEVTV